MGNMSGRMRTYGFEKQQNDPQENRQRVATYSEGKTFAYEDASFIQSKDQSVIDFFTDSGRTAHKGWFINDGPGDIKLEFSVDGTTYGGIHTIKGSEQVDLTDFSIKKIRLTWVSDSAYRALLM